MCIDNSFIKTRKGRRFLLQRSQKRKGIKIHECVSFDGFPLSILSASVKGRDREHFIEVLADAAYDNTDISSI